MPNWTQAGVNTMQIVARVHCHAGLPGMNHPTTSNSNTAGSTRLRRKLSKIFHHEISEIGLETRSTDSPGTCESSQPAICQSPRSQRCLRRLWALWCEG